MRSGWTALLVIFAVVTARAERTPLEDFYETQFAKYAVPGEEASPKGELQIGTDAKARRYRTALRRDFAAADAPNFAESYFVPHGIGCGTGCRIVFVVDWKTGKVFSAPEDHAFEVRRNSRLLVLKPYAECTAYGPPILYEFVGGKFRTITHTECNKL